MNLTEFEELMERLAAGASREHALEFGARTLRRHFEALGQTCDWRPEELAQALAVAPEWPQELVESLIQECSAAEDPEAPDRGVPVEALEFLVGLREYLRYLEDGNPGSLLAVSYRALAFVDGTVDVSDDSRWDQHPVIEAEMERQIQDLGS